MCNQECETADPTRTLEVHPAESPAPKGGRGSRGSEEDAAGRQTAPAPAPAPAPSPAADALDRGVSDAVDAAVRLVRESGRGATALGQETAEKLRWLAGLLAPDRRPAEVGSGIDRVEHLAADPNYAFAQPTEKRYNIFPLEYPTLWDRAQRLESTAWRADAAEVDLGNEAVDFREVCRMEPGLKWQLWNILGFFAPSDGMILENIQVSLSAIFAIPEVRAWYGVQGANEKVHEEMYGKLVSCYIENVEQRRLVHNSVWTMPGVRGKVEWAEDHMNKHHRSIAHRLVAMTVVEGLFFTSSFGWIYWVAKRFPTLLKGLTKSNEWISGDENRHVEFGAALYHLLPHKMDILEVAEIYLSGLKRELAFVQDMFRTKIRGLSVERLTEHVRFMANYWFAKFQAPTEGSEPRLLTLNADGTVPRPMDEFLDISITPKINFFEVKNGNYSLIKVTDQKYDPRRAF